MKKLLVINPRSMNSQMHYVHNLNFFAKNLELETFLICESVGENQLSNRVHIIETGKHANRLFSAWKLYSEARNLITSENIECIISAYGHFSSLLPLFMRKYRKKGLWHGALIYDLRSASVSHFFDNIQNRLYALESKAYDYRMAVSESAADRVFSSPDAVDFICGVGTLTAADYPDHERSGNQVTAIKKHYSITDDDTILLYIGTLRNRELDRFIRQMDFDTDSFHFLVIGDGDRSSGEKLNSAIADKHIGNNIHLCGRLPGHKLLPYLQLADIGIAYSPSHSSLAEQPMTKLHEYHEFDISVLTNDPEKHAFCPQKSILLGESDKLSVIIATAKTQLANSGCKDSIVYWKDWHRQLEQFLGSIETR